MTAEGLESGEREREREGINGFAGDFVIPLQQKLQLSCQDEMHVGYSPLLWLWLVWKSELTAEGPESRDRERDRGGD